MGPRDDGKPDRDSITQPANGGGCADERYLPVRLNAFHLHDDRNVIERDVFSRLEREKSERETRRQSRFTPDGTI